MIEGELLASPAFDEFRGGCIVAGFTDTAPNGGWPLIGGMRKAREVEAVRKALRDLEDRFQAAAPAPASLASAAPRREVAPQHAAAANQ